MLFRSSIPKFGKSNAANSDSTRQKKRSLSIGIQQKNSGDSSYSWWDAAPDLPRVANGVAHTMDRLKAIGNGQVPLQAAVAWKILEEIINDAL